jgi:hypothetical protein
LTHLLRDRLSPLGAETVGRDRMTFRSDPARPGSDAWAMLDDEGARILGPRFVLLRQHILIIRRWTQRNWKTNRPSSYSQPKQAGHV